MRRIWALLAITVMVAPSAFGQINPMDEERNRLSRRQFSLIQEIRQAHYEQDYNRVLELCDEMDLIDPTFSRSGYYRYRAEQALAAIASGEEPGLIEYPFQASTPEPDAVSRERAQMIEDLNLTSPLPAPTPIPSPTPTVAPEQTPNDASTTTPPADESPTPVAPSIAQEPVPAPAPVSASSSDTIELPFVGRVSRNIVYGVAGAIALLIIILFVKRRGKAEDDEEEDQSESEVSVMEQYHPEDDDEDHSVVPEVATMRPLVAETSSASSDPLLELVQPHASLEEAIEAIRQEIHTPLPIVEEIDENAEISQPLSLEGLAKPSEKADLEFHPGVGQVPQTIDQLKRPSGEDSEPPIDEEAEINTDPRMPASTDPDDLLDSTPAPKTTDDLMDVNVPRTMPAPSIAETTQEPLSLDDLLSMDSAPTKNPSDGPSIDLGPAPGEEKPAASAESTYDPELLEETIALPTNPPAAPDPSEVTISGESTQMMGEREMKQFLKQVKPLDPEEIQTIDETLEEEGVSADDQLFAQYRRQGQEALDTKNWGRAMQMFQLALNLKPNARDAIKGLQKAQQGQASGSGGFTPGL